MSFEIHCFADAKLAAYETELYLISVPANGKVITSFICSKSRAPLKMITLPRLELMGALSARLVQEVSEFLKFDVNSFFGVILQ